MPPNPQSIPFINVRTQENRTPTGRRTSTPARHAVRYYAYGRHQEAQLAGKQRGQWWGPDGCIHTQAEVTAWVKTNAIAHRYTFQGVLSVPEGELSAAEFGQALQKGGQTEDWRLIAHSDTQHRHAHVLWFGDKRMGKDAFLLWQSAVRAELVRLEQQQAADRAARQEMALAADQARSHALGQGVG